MIDLMHFLTQSKLSEAFLLKVKYKVYVSCMQKVFCKVLIQERHAWQLTAIISLAAYVGYVATESKETSPLLIIIPGALIKAPISSTEMVLLVLHKKSCYD